MNSHMPGVLGPPPGVDALTAISPSRFAALQQCALREVWAANRVPALLPTGPAARLGTVVHRLLEEAGRGVLNAGEADSRWNALIAAAEQAASQNWLDRHLLPFRTAIPDFEVRALQALERARLLAAEAAPIPRPDMARGETAVGYELPVETPDGKARGSIDAVIPGEGGPVLRDYKSGAIFEPGPGTAREIKTAYANQLKLYAAIYSAMTGTWPSRLEVVPVAGEPQAVEFSAAECEQLLDQAIHTLDAVNDVISSPEPYPSRHERLARPAPQTCGNCPYRPGCAPYAAAAAADPEAGWPPDRCGRLTELRVLGNGSLMLALDSGTATVRIRSIDPSPQRHPALEVISPGDSVSAFNLRPAGGPTSFAQGRFTVLYKFLPTDSQAGSNRARQ
jgi:PD-(D/E)XK nuclease superfamily